MKADLKRARKAIKRAVQLAPTQARYHYWDGVLAACSSIAAAHSVLTWPALPFRARASIAAFEQAVALQPEYHQARTWLLETYTGLPWYLGGSQSKAEEHAAACEDFDPVWGAKARCLVEARRDPKRQVTIWQDVVGSHPDRADAHAGLARALLRTRDTEQAQLHAQKAVALDSSEALVLLEAARRCLSEGDLIGAERLANAYLDVQPLPAGPCRARGLRMLARVRERQGKAVEAGALRDEAAALDPVDWWPPVPPEELYTPPPPNTLQGHPEEKI